MASLLAIPVFAEQNSCDTYCRDRVQYTGTFNERTGDCEYQRTACRHGCNGNICATVQRTTAETQERPRTYESCPDVCRAGILSSQGRYDNTLRRCEYQKSRCENGCATNLKSCALPSSTQCNEYCEQGTHYHTGRYDAGRQTCSYSRELCRFGCDKKREKCSPYIAVVDECLAYCEEDVLYYDGYYDIGAETCKYTRTKCENGCNSDLHACDKPPQRTLDDRKQIEREETQQQEHEENIERAEHREERKGQRKELPQAAVTRPGAVVERTETGMTVTTPSGNKITVIFGDGDRTTVELERKINNAVIKHVAVHETVKNVVVSDKEGKTKIDITVLTRVKLFGLFPTEMPVRRTVDIENQEKIESRPWWDIFVSNEDDVICNAQEDCQKYENNNLCDGTLYCDLESYECKINPATVVTCPTVDDTACLQNICQLETGECEMQTVIDGTLCDDGNACTSNDSCQAGQCISREFVCECAQDSDCDKHEKTTCDGEYFCNKSQGVCQQNPTTIPTSCA